MSADIYEDDLALYAKTAWHRLGHVHGDLIDLDTYLDYPWPFVAQREPLYVKNPTWAQWIAAKNSNDIDTIVRICFQSPSPLTRQGPQTQLPARTARWSPRP